MTRSILPFLMFQGDGATALDFYLSVFPDANAEIVDRYEDEGATPGAMKLARLTVAGQTILLHDSAIKHAFDFTPSMSLFVECGSAEEVRRLSATLGQGGAELMPVANYGFSTLFAWVSDRFGVSWQLNFI